MRPLRVLAVEDNPDDVVLMELEMRRGGFAPSVRRVETAEEMRAALAEGEWDVVLSDYCMPRFRAPEALRVLQETGRDIPFIVVSGSVGEEEGVEVMRAGARDYFPKDRLARLPAAVARELAEARARRARAREAVDRELLGRASEALTAPLDFQARLEQLTRLPVPAVADWSAVFLVREGGTLRLASVAHADPERVRQAFALEARYPARMDAPVGPPQVLRTGQPELVEELPERLEALAHDAEHLRGLHWLGLRSVLHVPLPGSRGVLGILTLATTEAHRRLGPEDLALAQELARRASLALENARLYQEAQEAVRLRDEFLTVAAHELRTPLTTLNLQLASLRQRAARERLSEDVLQRMERLGRQVLRLATLVEGLLDVSRLASGALVLSREPLDLCALVTDVAQRYEAEARSAGCALRLEVPPELVGHWDRLRVDQAVASLLSNALKFGPGQPVELSVKRVDGRARVEVCDRGIGIPEEQLERIFERFGRAVSSRSYGGLGLGLYLARRTAEAHGGRVWAEAREGGGARFTLELPLESEEARR
jgi:signal transduction histidine kinase/DNA-binding NarL/FixJ family response regulator